MLGVCERFEDSSRRHGTAHVPFLTGAYSSGRHRAKIRPPLRLRCHHLYSFDLLPNLLSLCSSNSAFPDDYVQPKALPRILPETKVFCQDYPKALRWHILSGPQPYFVICVQYPTDV